MTATTVRALRGARAHVEVRFCKGLRMRRGLDRDAGPAHCAAQRRRIALPTRRDYCTEISAQHVACGVQNALSSNVDSAAATSLGSAPMVRPLRRVAGTLIITALAALAGCSGDDDSADPTSPTQPSATTTSEPVVERDDHVSDRRRGSHRGDQFVLAHVSWR